MKNRLWKFSNINIWMWSHLRAGESIKSRPFLTEGELVCVSRSFMALRCSLWRWVRHSFSVLKMAPHFRHRNCFSFKVWDDLKWALATPSFLKFSPQTLQTKHFPANLGPHSGLVTNPNFPRLCSTIDGILGAVGKRRPSFCQIFFTDKKYSPRWV